MKFAPNKDQWTPDIRYYKQALLAKFKDGKKELELFTPGTEAFIFVICDNNWDKWVYTAKYYKKKGNFSAPLPKVKTKVDDGAGNMVKEADPFHDAKYTSTDCGQVQYGTFSKEGFKVYNKLRKDITKLRKDNLNDMLGMEAEFLPMFRKLDDIPDEPAQKKSGKSKKRKLPGSGSGQDNEGNADSDSENDEWMEE